jgi:nucleoside-diphosphate-sugar epimerase
VSIDVLVTGAGGFVGRALVRRLLREGLDGRVLRRLVVADLALAGLPGDARLRCVEGSIAEPAVVARALAEPVDVVFHLASVPGGASERDPALSRAVNLDATQHLLDRLRGQGGAPRLVFASTVAVYGDPLPPRVDEDTPARPALTYGAHKLASEILIADATRRNGVRGLSLRLPGVVARPGDASGLMSAFMSQLFWRLRAGEPIVLPVSADGQAWWISAGACVDNLLHAALDTAAAGRQGPVQMPALHLAVRDVIEGLARAYGADRRALVRYAPQPQVQRLFASCPPLDTPRARAWGYVDDGSVDRLVQRATAEE